MSTPAGDPPGDEPREAPGATGDEAGDVAGDVAGNEASGVAVDAARRARVERAVRGALAAALCLEALTVLFVPRAIAPVSDSGLTGGRLAVLLVLAAALLVAAGLQRSRAGIALGSVLQVAVLATGVLSAAMYALGLLFGSVWIYLLRVRRELTGAGRPPTP